MSISVLSSIVDSIDLLQLKRLTKLSEQGKLIFEAFIIYINLLNYLSLILNNDFNK